MYLIKSVTFNFVRRLVLVSRIIIGSFKDILRIVLYPPSLALRLITKPFKRHRFKHYKPMRRHNDSPGDKPGLNHKHDNYQSQIDGFHRKVNELLLNDEAYNKQFNRLENLVNLNEKNIRGSIDTIGNLLMSADKDNANKINVLEDKVDRDASLAKRRRCNFNDKIESLERIIDFKIRRCEAKVDKLLSENSELTFKPLTKEEERLQDIELEANWHKHNDANFPSEPNFDSEQEAMDKQIADVKKRDEEWEALNPEDDEQPITNEWLNDKA